MEPDGLTFDGGCHQSQLFIALPDGSALLYQLRGYAEKPESTMDLILESPAKKPTSTTALLENWLPIVQKFIVTVVLYEKPCTAVFVTVSDMVEVGPNSAKDFPVRFVSHVEGITKGTITFTNISTGVLLFCSSCVLMHYPESTLCFYFFHHDAIELKD